VNAVAPGTTLTDHATPPCLTAPLEAAAKKKPRCARRLGTPDDIQSRRLSCTDDAAWINGEGSSQQAAALR